MIGHTGDLRLILMIQNPMNFILLTQKQALQLLEQQFANPMVQEVARPHGVQLTLMKLQEIFITKKVEIGKLIT